MAAAIRTEPNVNTTIALLAGLLAVALTSSCRRETATAAEVRLPTVRVQVSAVQRVALPVIFETTGTVRAVQRATVAARLSGSIATLSLRLGDTVRAGDVLLTIAAADVSARVVQVRAQLAQVERELTRERGLLATGAGTKDNVKLLEDRLAQTQASLREAETLLDYATVRAPFNGTIARKHVEAGDFASAGAPLIQIDGRDAFEIEVGLPESLAAPLAVGTNLEVETMPGGLRFQAAIAEISSASDSVARSRTAKLAVPTGTQVSPGQFSRVFLPSGSTAALLVPSEAVVRFGQMERVFAVGDQNRANLRLVRTGATRGNQIEIVSGLDAVDRVVIAPPASLHDGQSIEIAP